MSTETERVHIALSDDDTDAEEIERAAESLISELALLDVNRIEPVSAGEAPPGTRGDSVAAVGEMVAILSSPAVVAAVLAVVENWLARWGRGKVKVKIGEDEIEVSSATTAQQDDLIKRFVEAHTDRP